MKLILGLLMFSSLSFAGEIEFEQIVGKYRMISKNPITTLESGFTMEEIITISESHSIHLIDRIIQSVEGQEPRIFKEFTCNGIVVLDADDNLISEVLCGNGDKYIQKIDLSGVEDIMAKEFMVPVYTSLHNTNIEMIINRIDDKQF